MQDKCRIKGVYGEKPSVIFDNKKDTLSKLLSICSHQLSLKALITNSLLLRGITVISQIALNVDYVTGQN